MDWQELTDLTRGRQFVVERVRLAGSGVQQCEGPLDTLVVVGGPGAPVLRKIVGDARGDAEGPVNVGGREASIGGGVPERASELIGVRVIDSGRKYASLGLRFHCSNERFR